MQYKDMLGQEIKVGDTIAYPTKSGYAAILRIGRVKELKPPGGVSKLRVEVEGQKDASIRFPEYTIVLKG